MACAERYTRWGTRDRAVRYRAHTAFESAVPPDRRTRTAVTGALPVVNPFEVRLWVAASRLPATRCNRMAGCRAASGPKSCVAPSGRVHPGHPRSVPALRAGGRAGPRQRWRDIATVAGVRRRDFTVMRKRDGGQYQRHRMDFRTAHSLGPLQIIAPVCTIEAHDRENTGYFGASLYA